MRGLLALLFLLLAGSAQAQTAVNCPTYNTTVLSAENTRVISACSLSSGPYDTLVAVATGELTCGPNSTGSISTLVSLTNQSTGANFTISGISGGQMNVTSMITPGSFTINFGDYLHDANSGSGIPIGTGNPTVGGIPARSSSLLQVGTQVSGTTGGVGVYNVVNAVGSVPTVGAETVWSLPKFCCGPSGRPAATNQLRILLEHIACQNGKTYIVSQTGISPRSFVANSTLWVMPTLAGEDLGSGTQSASWNNGQVTVYSLATLPAAAVIGGLVQ